MKNTKRQWLMLALGLLMVGAVGLVATQYVMANSEPVYLEDDCWAYSEEEALYEEIDSIYEANEDVFGSLEEDLEELYSGLDDAVELGNDSEIVLLVKQIYALEAELETLDEKTGIAALYDELDLLYEDEEDSFEDEEDFEDEEEFEDDSAEE